MALIKCKECRNEISSKAKSCPKCGAGIKRTSFITTIFAAVLVLAVIGVIVGPGPQQSETTAEAPASGAQMASAIDKSPEMEAKRKQLIGEMQERGLIGKVECRASIADLWVMPSYLATPYEHKKGIASVVYALCFDGNNQFASVRLVHNLTGKKVGSFSMVGGLEIS